MEVTNDQKKIAQREANARRQREYRARKRALMGDSSYLESVAKYKRDLRGRKKDPEQTPVPVQVQAQVQAPAPVQVPAPKPEQTPVPAPKAKPVSKNNCKKLTESIKSQTEKKGKKVSTSTTKTQLGRVSNLYKAMTSKDFDCNDFEWTRDTGRVLDFIENNKSWDSKDRSKQNTRNAYRTSLASILRDMVGYEREQQLYSLYASNIFSKKISNKIAEGKLSVTQQKNYLPFEKLLDARKFFDKGTQQNAIISIYTDTPPRRALDYQVMKVIKKKNKAVTQSYIDDLKNDKDFNYVILDSKNRPYEFIFNNFKTANSIGTQVLSIPVELSKTLQSYILKEGINNGDILFSNSRGKSYANFAEVVKKAFKQATGKNITVNLIRHAYITYYLQTKRTVNERKKLAELMGHDINTQSLYEIID
jgi:hypothetical protein